MDNTALLQHINATVTAALGGRNKEVERVFVQLHAMAADGELDLEWGIDDTRAALTARGVPADAVDGLIAAFTSTTLVNDEDAAK